MNRPLAPTVMNRQVGPSILLSVAIVCFFAVALYQHDPPRTPDGQSRSRSRSADAIARSGSSRPVGGKRPASGHADPFQAVGPVSVGMQSAPRAVTAASNSSIAGSDRTPVRLARERAIGSNGSDEATSDESIEAARRPASPFTVVAADETLEDVARRIYGSGAHVNSLWRANRDTVSRRTAPLAAGMVLRTPPLR